MHVSNLLLIYRSCWYNPGFGRNIPSVTEVARKECGSRHPDVAVPLRSLVFLHGKVSRNKYNFWTKHIVLTLHFLHHVSSLAHKLVNVSYCGCRALAGTLLMMQMMLKTLENPHYKKQVVKVWIIARKMSLMLYWN